MRWTLSQREDKQIVFILIFAFSLIVFRWKGGGLFSRKGLFEVFYRIFYQEILQYYLVQNKSIQPRVCVRDLSYVNPSPMTFIHYPIAKYSKRYF